MALKDKFLNGRGLYSLIDKIKNFVKPNQQISGGETNLTSLEVNGTNYVIPQGISVVANPTLAGTESELTGLEVSGTKYKVPKDAIYFTFYSAFYDYSASQFSPATFSMTFAQIADAIENHKFIYGINIHDSSIWLLSDYNEDVDISFTSYKDDYALELFIYLNDTYVGRITSLRGQDGVDGRDGQDGVDGRDGQAGVDGRDGQDGVDGRDGVALFKLITDNSFNITGVVLPNGSLINFSEWFNICVNNPDICFGLNLYGNTTATNYTSIVYYYQDMYVDEEESQVTGSTDIEVIGKIVFKASAVDYADNPLFSLIMPPGTTDVILVWSREYDSQTDSYVESFSLDPISIANYTVTYTITGQPSDNIYPLSSSVPLTEIHEMIDSGTNVNAKITMGAQSSICNLSMMDNNYIGFTSLMYFNNAWCIFCIHQYDDGQGTVYSSGEVVPISTVQMALNATTGELNITNVPEV